LNKKSHYRELIALTLVPNLGVQRIRQLLKYFESPADVFNENHRKIRQIDGLGPAIAAEISRFHQWDLVDEILHKTEKTGSELISIHDPDYPHLLKQIYDAPPLLWVRGNAEALSTPGIAVIGTRKADKYARSQAEKWSELILHYGLSVISGLAYGVDTIAHQTAVDRNSKTIAVLGSGIDWIYPEQNVKLADKITDCGGAVISEFPPGTKPDAGNFPVRNRIVSGLSLGVLVIQSGIKGGSMITARSALDQNREVFVIPHNLDQKNGDGNHYLIRTGQGKLVEKIEDILLELQMTPDLTEQNRKEESVKKWKSVTLSDTQKMICSAIEEGYTQIDQIAEETGKSTQKLLPILLELEMEDIVVQSAGKYFELK
jgi:DNA processing protein